MEMGCGQMGMTIDEFWNATPREFFNKMQGVYEHQKFLQQEAWKRMRHFAWLLLQPYIERGKELTPEQLMPFEWERPDPGEVKRLSREEIEDLKQKYSKGAPTNRKI
jgi:hypothetical protein